MKTVLQILGLAAILVGLLWMAQGSGIFPYPRASFMIDQRPWVVRGALLLALGLVLAGLSRRIDPR